jgi:serine/threonine protein kinase
MAARCVLCTQPVAADNSYCPSCGVLLPPSEETADPLIGTIVADRYEILALISAGGMGRVYRAEQKMLERMVAIKIIDPRAMRVNQTAELTARFMTEARASSRLNHPNVVSVFDFGRTSPAEHAPLFLAMELLTGPTLADVLASTERRMPLPRVASILRQTLAALGEAHHLGITHRDIKPANIVLQKRARGDVDHVSVIDFGVARIGTERGMTEQGRLLGTPHYMAPEAITASGAGPSVDLYAVGIILFEMLTGRVPFDDASAMTICLNHTSAPRPDPRSLVPDLPEGVASVCFRALAVDPEARYVDAQALAEAITEALSAPMTARQASVFPPRNPAKEAPTLPKANPSGEVRGEAQREVRSEFVDESPSMRMLARRLPTFDTGATPVVGRDDLLEWARGLLAAPRDVSAIAFWGKTGTGRSRMLQEVSAIARANGAEVVEVAVDWGPRYEAGYTGLRELVARLAGHAIDDARLIAGHASDERLVSTGLRELFGTPGTTLADEPGAMRNAVMAALAWGVQKAAKRAGERLVVVVLDNVDRIDGISRACLWDFLKAGVYPNVVALLSSEDRPPAASHGGIHEREILALSRIDASALVTGSRNADRESPPDSRMAPRRVEPLYLEQYRRWRTERPRDRAPNGLREIVEARLQELEPAPRRVLQALAVGGAISADKVAALLDRRDGVDEAIRALSDAGFVVVDSGTGGLVRVVHALYARVALDNAPAGVIEHLHARAAEVLAATSADVERRAYHRIRTRPNLETFMLVERTVRLRTLRGDDEGAIAALSDGYFVARTSAARGDADGHGWQAFGRKLAAALLRAGRNDQANGLLLEVLETLGPTDHARVPVLEDLASIAQARGKLEDAERWRREASQVPQSSRPSSRVARASRGPAVASKRPSKRTSGNFTIEEATSRISRTRIPALATEEPRDKGEPTKEEPSKGRKR